MAKMTKRERALRTIRFEETDRVPLYDIIQNDAVIEHYAGRPLDGEKDLETVGMAVGCCLDMTRMVTTPQSHGSYRRDDGIVIQQERWTSWIIERPFHDLDTLVPWVKERIREADAYVCSPEEVAALHQHIEARCADFAKGDPTGRNDPTVYVLESAVGLTDLYWAPGMDLFVEFMMCCPDLTEEWLDANHRRELRRVAAIARPDLFPVALTYDDIAFKTGPMFSPDWLRRLWVPRLKALVEAWHSRDTYCLFHSDGNLWLVLDDLVEAGIDGLNPLETMADMHPKAVRERYPALFLTGGIDVSQLLSLGTPEEVRTVCRQAIADTQGRGYFMGSTTELHWELPLENARAMFETAWEQE